MLETLGLYLARDTPFAPLDILKLWKGLFYCMWLTPNPVPQQRLAQEFASFVPKTLQRQNVLPFLDAFWETLGREWNSIDSLRLDKYLRLARCMLREEFLWLKRMQWDQEILTQHNAMMEKTALNVGNAKVPNGLRYHVIDIFVDEMDEVQDKNDMIPVTVLQELLKPLQGLKQKSPLKPVRQRAKEALDDDRLKEWSSEHITSASSGVDDKGLQVPESADDEWAGLDD